LKKQEYGDEYMKRSQELLFLLEKERRSFPFLEIRQDGRQLTKCFNDELRVLLGIWKENAP
jgi:hypothetical protein